MKSRTSGQDRIASRKAQSGRAEMVVDSPPGVESGHGRANPGRVKRNPQKRYRAETSDSAQARLAAALRQIDALNRLNEKLKLQVIGLGREIEKARVFAFHDPLTGLPNRRLLLDHFQQAKARARREQKRLALMFIDLDGFKFVNDQFGHVAGDAILKEAAGRLKESVRDGETACRFGGDEFVVLLDSCNGQQAAWVAAKRISTQLSKAYVLGDATIEITASTGMAIFPDDGQECGDLIEVADVSMLGQKRCRLGLPKVL